MSLPRLLLAPAAGVAALFLSAALAPAAGAAGSQRIDRTVELCFPQLSADNVAAQGGVLLHLEATAPTSLAPGEQAELTDVVADIRLEGGYSLPIVIDDARDEVVGQVTDLRLSASNASPSSLAAQPLGFGPARLSEALPLTSSSSQPAALRDDLGDAPQFPAFEPAGAPAPIALRVQSVTATWTARHAASPERRPTTFTTGPCPERGGQPPLALITTGSPQPAAPTITSLTPNSSADAGGAQVTVTGTGLATTRLIQQRTIGVFPYAAETITDFTVIDDTTVRYAAPRSFLGGARRVVITTDYGQTADTPADDFSYDALPVPDPDRGDEAQPAAAGQWVTITGRNLDATRKATVEASRTAGGPRDSDQPFEVVSPSELKVQLPADAAPGAWVNVWLRNADLQRTNVAAWFQIASSVTQPLALAHAGTLQFPASRLTGRLAFDGAIDATLTPSTGAVTGTLGLTSRAAATLYAFGALPVQTRIDLSAGAIDGTWDGSALAVTAPITASARTFTFLGVRLLAKPCALPVVGPVTLRSKSGFSLTTGGLVSGAIRFGRLKGCGTADAFGGLLLAGTAQLALVTRPAA